MIGLGLGLNYCNKGLKYLDTPAYELYTGWLMYGVFSSALRVELINRKSLFIICQVS